MTCIPAQNINKLFNLLIAVALCSAGLALSSGLALAQSALPEIQLSAAIIADPESSLPRQIKGTMQIKGWHPEHGHCLYLPYNDPDYGDDRGTQRRLEMFSERQARVVFDYGQTNVLVTQPAQAVAPPPLISKLPFIYQINVPDHWTAGDILELSFESNIPRLPSSSPSDWFYEGFFPQLLDRCRSEALESVYYRTTLPARINAEIKLPQSANGSGWLYAGPGKAPLPDSSTIVIQTSGRNLAFALSRNYQHATLDVDGVVIRLYYHSESFVRLMPTIKAALAAQTRMFGPYPFPDLTIVETTELQRHGLPGLIAVNVPRQAVFNAMQKEWLNWQHWMIATQIAMQWFGGSVGVNTPDDEWLLSGMIEFATLETLKHLPQRYNLFNPTDEGFRLLSFDYLQISEISAATLQRYAPFFILTTPDFQTKTPFHQQPGLGYIKHAFALRQLKSYAGEQTFFGFLRGLVQHHAFSSLSPAQFHDFIKRLPSPFSPLLRQELQAFLTQWWTVEGFPDFALDSFDKQQLTDSKWLARIQIGQKGSIDFPPMVAIKDESDRTHLVRANKSRSQIAGAQDAATSIEQDDAPSWLAEIITPYEPYSVKVDPGREAFDSDRFNNRSGLPMVRFFPGSADTLRDDAYTVIWLPYAFRRPGEPTSVALQAALFRYIQGGLFFRLEGAPSEKLGAFELRHRYYALSHAIHGDFSFSQTYENDRLGEASMIRSPLFAAGPHLSLNLRLRHRERVGEKSTRHQTIVVGAGVKPAGTARSYDYSLSGSFEYAPDALAEGFHYARHTGLLVGSLSLGPRTDISSRLFFGDVNFTGEPPPATFFKPTDLRESRLRLDLRGLTRVSQITALGTDILLPFYMPLPADSMILTRQMRWRLFYDYGQGRLQESSNQDLHNIEYRATGVGFLLPFGGDLSGAGSLALTRLSLIAVLYSSAEGRISRKPGILFDLSGEL